MQSIKALKMRIHFIAIGGAIMHNMAIVLKRQGHNVSGSDDKIADPAKTNLEKEGLLNGLPPISMLSF